MGVIFCKVQVPLRCRMTAIWPQDDRKGHPYYTRSGRRFARPGSDASSSKTVYSRDDPRSHPWGPMTLAVIREG